MKKARSLHDQIKNFLASNDERLKVGKRPLRWCVSLELDLLTWKLADKIRIERSMYGIVSIYKRKKE